MDQQHPIPQDVTGFQFKLIGEMTIKQFIYLAAGVVLAYLTFASGLYWFIKFPFVFLFGGLGVCLAFIPIEGRPFDVMLTNFLKAFITPNQFVYQKMGYELLPTTFVPIQKKTIKEEKKEQEEKIKLSEKKLQQYLNSLPKAPKNSLDEKEMRFLGTLPLAQVSGQPTSSTSAVSIPTISGQVSSSPTAPSDEVRNVSAQPIIASSPTILEELPNTPLPTVKDDTDQSLEQEAAIIEQEISQAKQEEQKSQNTPLSTSAHTKVVNLEKELADILSQKASLQNQLITLKKELAAQKQQVFTPGVMPMPTVKAQTQNVRSIPQALGKSVGLPIAPDVANLLTGIVKDPRGNTLPNILVEVKDRDNNPVRAFKTNGLGQFAAATPLANGVYTMSFEDPAGKQTFDSVELPVTGMIIQPLEVISIDSREQLRQELFK